MDIRILVVDDDQDSVDLVEKILKKDGYRVVTLTDGRKVDEELRKNDIHLAIIDLKMPEVSGLDVVQTVKQHDSDCAVILMTGYATLDSAVSALRGGVVDYLRKPVRELYPHPDLLAACRERDVPVTLGSDAHSPDVVGRDFDRARELLRSAGYETVTVFELRRARQEPLG